MRHAVAILLLPLAAAPLLSQALAASAGVDPKRIVNESNSFLKEREPEMTEEEYALYEKVLTILSSNPDFALKLLESMMTDKEPPSPAFEFILGNAYYAAGRMDASEARYRSAVKRYPSFLRAWVNLGVLYYSTDRYGDAIPCFSKAVVLGDRDSTTFGMLGYCLEKEGNVVSSEMAYMQALSGDPDSPTWKEGLLRICIAGKQFSRAESLVKDIIKERPRDTQLWLIYANILLSEGRMLVATVVLESASGLGLAGAEELSLLGDLYADQGLYREAEGAYRRVFAQSPDIGGPRLLHFAQVLISDGRLQEAQDVLGAIKPELTPAGQIELLQARADILAAQRRWPEARKELQQLLGLEPLNGRALLSMGRAYAAEDDIPRATFSFEEASRVEGTAYLACLELANIELRNRHFIKSVEYLEKAVGIQKTDAVEDYLARVRTLAAKEDQQQ